MTSSFQQAYVDWLREHQGRPGMDAAMRRVVDEIGRLMLSASRKTNTLALESVKVCASMQDVLDDAHAVTLFSDAAGGVNLNFFEPGDRVTVMRVKEFDDARDLLVSVIRQGGGEGMALLHVLQTGPLTVCTYERLVELHLLNSQAADYCQPDR